MGIIMYKPVCGYAYHDSLSSLYLSCTTFDDSSEMSGMKRRKRMNMDSVIGTTSDDYYRSNTPWLQTLSHCMKKRCATDGADEAKIEKLWNTLADDGLTPPSYSSILPATAPTVELVADAVWLNKTSLVDGDLYYPNHQTLQEFEFQEDMHVRLS